LRCSIHRVGPRGRVVIKKYGNRRLYDTGDSRYVTLDELAGRIRSGVDVRVVGAETGEDLTQATLTQIVLETGNAAKFLPVQLLTQMIRLSDDALAGSPDPLAQLPVAASDALARMWMGNPFAPPSYQQPYAYAQGSPYVAPPPPDDLEPDDAPRDRKSSPTMTADRKSNPAMTVDRNSSPATNGERDDVAAMRRELDELKQLMRDGMAKPARRSVSPNHRVPDEADDRRLETDPAEPAS
jgi:polyhydroxyalkanoate synthesis repressor PhaR